MGTAECVDDYKNENFPSSPYEPISVISTDSPFINSHTDVFNENVVAYMATAVLENQYKKIQEIPSNIDIKNHCFGKKGASKAFNFAKCEAFFRDLYIDDFCQEFSEYE